MRRTVGRIPLTARKPINHAARASRSERSPSSTQRIRGMRPRSSTACSRPRERIGASDVHFQPGAGGLDLTWRVDGVLIAVTSLSARIAPNIVARLKVLAELLTYRTDVPQEGRIRGAPGEVEMRVSTFPTLFGEKAVVRMFASPGLYLRLADLGLPEAVTDLLGRLLGETSGAIVLSGPAGSGKTTTIYACLRELTARSSRPAQSGNARRPDRGRRHGRGPGSGQRGRRSHARDRASSRS